MKKYLEEIKSAISDLSYESKEALDHPRELSDMAHEHADSNERVIYTTKAHENVSNANRDERDYAENQFMDLGGIGEGTASHGGGIYDRAAVLLSYHIEEYRYTEIVRNELENLKEFLEELRDEIQDDENYENDDLIYAEADAETKLGAIEEILG